jgi:hypothetical protein
VGGFDAVFATRFLSHPQPNWVCCKFLRERMPNWFALLMVVDDIAGEHSERE